MIGLDFGAQLSKVKFTELHNQSRPDSYFNQFINESKWTFEPGETTTCCWKLWVIISWPKRFILLSLGWIPFQVFGITGLNCSAKTLNCNFNNEYVYILDSRQVLCILIHFTSNTHCMCFYSSKCCFSGIIEILLQCCTAVCTYASEYFSY